MTEAERIYAEVVAFIEARGWRRIEPDEGWWVNEWGHDEMLGQALQEVLMDSGVDMRVPPAEATGHSS